MKKKRTRKSVPEEVVATVQEWLDANKTFLDLSRRQRIVVNADDKCVDGSILLTFVGIFGQGSWRKITHHFRNGGMESLQPHLTRLRWDKPRAVAVANQRSLEERRLRLRQQKN